MSTTTTPAHETEAQLDSEPAKQAMQTKPIAFPGSTHAAHASGARWSLWANQILSILQLEASRNLFSKRAVLIYLLTLSPLLLLATTAIYPPDGDEWGSFTGRSRIFAVFYEAFILRTVIFFGCAWIFMNLIRGEVVDRSLHYYFLAPVRREVFIVGKYLAGVMAAALFFATATALSLLLIHLPHGSANEFTGGAGMNLLFAYTGTSVLACIGYGALFLLIGLYFRNPVIPALIVYGWEWINFLLPPVLKKLSVIHYMHSLVPVPVDAGPFEVLAEPTPAYLAIPGLLILTAVALFLCARRARRMEILYGGE